MRYLVGIVAMVLIGAAFYAAGTHLAGDGAQEQQLSSAANTEREVPAGWREYRDERYQFSLLYPEQLEIEKIDEGEGAATIIFQNKGDVQGFQLFITPYGLPQVSEARFRKDIPSGVRTDKRDISIDGAVGASFYSRDEFLGDTAEVWFIQNSYLYEVTTLRPLEPWLSEILATWKFL